MSYPSNAGFSHSKDNRQRESILLWQRLCDTPFFVEKVRKYFLGHESFSSWRLNHTRCYLSSVEAIFLSLLMISVLGEGLWGKKLYAAMSIMRFAANLPTLLRRVYSVWTMCFNSSFIVLINALFLSRILSRRCINECFMFLRMRVIRWKQKTKTALRVRVVGLRWEAGALSKKVFW